MAIEEAPWTLTFMRPPLAKEGQDPDQPNYLTESCDYMARRSQLCRDLKAGHHRMLEQAPIYLPPYENESKPDYNERISKSSFRNFYGQAVSTILGKIFAKPPMLNEDVPEIMREDFKDADLNNNDWTIVAEELLNHAMDEGLSWLMVDYHTVPDPALIGNLTLKDEQDMGLRPYWIVIPQHKVLGVNYEKVGNIFMITMFRYWTRVKKRDGEFGESWSEQVRVIEPHRYRTFEKQDIDGKAGTWVGIEDLPNTLGRVPVIPLNLNKQGPFEAYPPLENLAYMNLEHFQIRSDQRRALSVASFPILAAFGVDPKSGSIKIGPMNSLAFEEEKASLKWVESQGVHLKAGESELTHLEGLIRTFGLSFENPGMYATATGRNIDASDSVAPIVRWAYRLRDVLNTALWYHAKWRKLPEGGTVNVDTSFIQSMITVEALKLLVEAYKAGALTAKSFLKRLKDYGILSGDFDESAEESELKKIADEEAANALSVIEATAAAKTANAPNDTGNAPAPGE